MFIVLLFQIGKIQKQSKRLSTNEWIKLLCYKPEQWNITHHKREWNSAFCNNVDVPKGNTSERERRDTLYYHKQVESKK